MPHFTLLYTSYFLLGADISTLGRNAACATISLGFIWNFLSGKNLVSKIILGDIVSKNKSSHCARHWNQLLEMQWLPESEVGSFSPKRLRQLDNSAPSKKGISIISLCLYDYSDSEYDNPDVIIKCASVSSFLVFFEMLTFFVLVLRVLLLLVDVDGPGFLKWSWE